MERERGLPGYGCADCFQQFSVLVPVRRVSPAGVSWCPFCGSVRVGPASVGKTPEATVEFR